MDVNDGYFEIIKEIDGVYIEINPPNEQGKKVEITDIVDGLRNEGIQDYDLINVMNELDSIKAKVKIKITNNQIVNFPLLSENDSQNDDFIMIYASDDKMKLFVKFFQKGDLKPNITVDELVNQIRTLKVKAQVDLENLKSILDDIKYNYEYLLASGVPMVESVPTTIKYHFKTEKDYRPEVDSEGNVNYHKLKVIANVKKGQVLASLVVGFEGVTGIDIFGNEYNPKKTKPVKLRRGKNTVLSEDQNELLAEVDGLVKIEDDKIVVKNVFEVPNNVGNSTGDIEFEGSVIVNGNVITGFKVVAKGDVEVNGVVEGATIEATGNVTLHRGIQGMSKSSIKAGGNVIARYIENAEVVAGGIIHSEAILHSTVSAKGEIKVEGKKGMITGGTVRSGTEISANILGSHMGTATNIEVGIDPLVWEEYNDLLKTLPKMKMEAERLEQAIVLLNKRKELEGDLDEQKKNMYLSATRNKIILTNKINQAEKRIEEVKEDVESRHAGKIKVRNILYPGVRITIGTAKYFVRDEIKYVCLYKEGADVKLTTL